MSSSLQDVQGLRVAVEGCVSSPALSARQSLTELQGHGTLNAIYAATEKACESRGWPDVDLLIIGGDFQVASPFSPSQDHADRPRQSAMSST
jgi:lariat debranching enzyme